MSNSSHCSVEHAHADLRITGDRSHLLSISAHRRLFRAELRRARDTGIATSDQEARPNLSCVVIALRDTARRPIAALSISGPSQDFDAARNAALLRAVSAEAEQLLRRAYVTERRDAAS